MNWWSTQWPHYTPLPSHKVPQLTWQTVVHELMKYTVTPLHTSSFTQSAPADMADSSSWTDEVHSDPTTHTFLHTVQHKCSVMTDSSSRTRWPHHMTHPSHNVSRSALPWQMIVIHDDPTIRPILHTKYHWSALQWLTLIVVHQTS